MDTYRLSRLALVLVAVLLAIPPVRAEWVPLPPMFDGQDGLGLPLQLYASNGVTLEGETLEGLGLQSKRVVERHEHWIPAKHDPMPRTLDVRILQFEASQDAHLYVKKAYRLFATMRDKVRTWNSPPEVGEASGWVGRNFVFIKGATIVAVEMQSAPNGPRIDSIAYLVEVARRVSRLLP